MDEFEYTKIAGAVLCALLLIFAPRAIIAMNTEHADEKPGYVLPVGAPEGDKPKTAAADTAPAGEAAGGAGDGDKSVLALLPKASIDNGKGIFHKCQACHVAEKGKTPTVGPNLWGVVNRPRASYPGFGYSDAMKAKGGNWSFDELAKFLHSPKNYIPGTKMVFNGLPTPNDEADVIAYLATLADTPVPLPK